MTLQYTETFYSAQGEGQYIGIPSLWMRFYLCNLECRGFGQESPTDPSTYKQVGNDIDLTDITDINQLPIFSVGCDSAYSVAKRYRHLITDRTVDEAVDELTALLPHGSFIHPVTKQSVHMVFTGGEPMLPRTQPGMVAILKEFERRNNLPNYVTIETNGTRKIGEELGEYLKEYKGEWFWSVSPKLWNTAGEKSSKAIKPEIVADYSTYSPHGQLKFVVNGSDASWKEVEEHAKAFRDAGCNFPIWIMGIGGTIEGLKLTEADIADEAIQRGYNYSSRVHVHLYGNQLGK